MALSSLLQYSGLRCHQFLDSLQGTRGTIITRKDFLFQLAEEVATEYIYERNVTSIQSLELQEPHTSKDKSKLVRSVSVTAMKLTVSAVNVKSAFVENVR